MSEREELRMGLVRMMRDWLRQFLRVDGIP